MGWQGVKLSRQSFGFNYSTLKICGNNNSIEYFFVNNQQLVCYFLIRKVPEVLILESVIRSFIRCVKTRTDFWILTKDSFRRIRSSTATPRGQTKCFTISTATSSRKTFICLKQEILILRIVSNASSTKKLLFASLSVLLQVRKLGPVTKIKNIKTNSLWRKRPKPLRLTIELCTLLIFGLC